MVLANLRNCSPSLCFIHNLNHVSVFSYLCLSCISLACLTLVAPPPYSCVVDLSTYVILSFCFYFCSLHQSFFFSRLRDRQKIYIFFLPPPGSCHPFFHFSLFTLPFTFLTYFSQLASLPACRNKHWALERFLACAPGSQALSFPLLLPHTFPVVITDKPHGLFTLVVWFLPAYHPRQGHRVRPWTLKSPTSPKFVDTKQSTTHADFF